MTPKMTGLLLFAPETERFHCQLERPENEREWRCQFSRFENRNITMLSLASHGNVEYDLLLPLLSIPRSSFSVTWKRSDLFQVQRWKGRWEGVSVSSTLVDLSPSKFWGFFDEKAVFRIQKERYSETAGLCLLLKCVYIYSLCICTFVKVNKKRTLLSRSDKQERSSSSSSLLPLL